MGVLDQPITVQDLDKEEAAKVDPKKETTPLSAGPQTTVPLRDISVSDAAPLNEAIEGIASAARGLTTGFNRELATAVGLPGDIVQVAAEQLGMNAEGYIANGKDVERLLNTLGIATTVDRTDRVARISHEVGRGLGLATPFAVGGVALAMRQGGGRISQFLAEPFEKAVGVSVSAELLSGLAVGATEAAMNEAGIENRLLRFGLSMAGGLGTVFLLGGKFRRASETPLAQNIDGPPGPGVFEVARLRAEDQLLLELKDAKEPAKFIDDALAVYREDLARIDPDDTRWPIGVKEQLVERLKGRMQRGEAPPKSRRPVEREAKVVDEFLRRSQAATKTAEKTSREKAVQAIETGWIDRAAPVRAALIENSGPAGKKAMMYFDLQAGSTAWSDHMTRAVRKETYKGMSRSERDVFDRFILNRRFKEIVLSRPKFKLPAKNLAAYELAEKKMIAEVGPERGVVFDQRAKQYFEHMRTPLKDMLDNGLITPDEFGKLSRFDYTPLEFANALDPKMDFKVGGRTISVPSSGIRPLGRAARDMLLTDSEVLISQVYSRSYGRIARNRANLELLDVARTQSDNAVVRLKRPKGQGDWTQLSVVENGKTRKMWMNNDFVDQWVNTTPSMSSAMAQQIGTWTGADMVRTMATGINPEFAVVNIFRDWFYAWMAPNELFGPTYSAFMPKGFSQMAADVLTVLPDVVKMEGRAIDYLREGGGMSFMTQGARGEATREAGRATAWGSVSDVLSVINARSELLTRLAIRERALKNGMSPEEATWTARTQIDFSQGGSASKFVDNFVPYLNASIQGLRGFTRAAQKNPAKMAAKVTQAMGAVAGLWAYNRMNHPDAMDQIDERVQANNFVFPLPGYYMDSAGNKRYRYLKVPVEHSFLPFKAIADAGMAKSMLGRVPRREIIEALQNSIPVFGDPIETGSVPAIRALSALANFDLWLKDDVWRGPQNLPASEEFRVFPDTPTPPLAVDVAQAIKKHTGMEVSPARWSNAVRALVPRNLYTTTMMGAYNKITTGSWQPEGEDADRLPAAVIQTRAPGIRRVMGTSHPLANIMELTQQIASGPAGETFAKTREADRQIARILTAPQAERGTMERSYRNWVKGLGSDFVHMRDSLNNRLNISKQIDKTFRRLEVPSNLPQRKWWITTAGLPSVQRATVFQHFESALDNSADRAAFNNIAKRIPGYFTPEFMQVLRRERKRAISGPTNMVR